jgi:hypothetical protein
MKFVKKKFAKEEGCNGGQGTWVLHPILRRARTPAGHFPDSRRSAMPSETRGASGDGGNHPMEEFPDQGKPKIVPAF